MKKGLKRILSTVLAAAMCMTSMAYTSVVKAADTITASSAGWFETAYTEWLPVSGATSYTAYVKTASDTEYTELDSELVRQYDTFWRADALGLAAGTYNMKIVANTGATYESGSITVNAYNRTGFAFSDGGSSSGGYNDDGTPKSNAEIFYVTDSNKDTITADVTTSSKGTTTTCTGMGAIIKALEKGYETTPYIFRFIGQVSCPQSSQSLNQLDIKKAQNPITIEGVGNDAVAKFGFNIVTGSNIEIRNLGFKDMTTSDEDGVTIKTNSERIWVHNCDFFYGGTGSDADQAKGDGSVDLKKKSTKITISDNHYWDSGKVNLCGLGESTDYEITYSRNWFDHSDSRHPRVRTGSIHVYNNYYDGVSKYGVGACTGSSIFVEGNYFRNTAKPVMSSGQGTDATGSGTFSGETGGIIKMYDNIMTGTYKYIEGLDSDGTVATLDCDGYTVSSKNTTLGGDITTVSGSTTYNNFDTDRDTASSDVMEASAVPAYVTTHAGRIDGGNFYYAFTDSTDDTDYAVNSALTSALASYTYGADTAYVSSKSATGIDGNTFYTTRNTAYTTKTSSLPTETEASGSSSGGSTSGGDSGSSTVTGDADLVLDGKNDVTAGNYTSNVTGLGTSGAFSIITNSSSTVTVSSSKGIQLGGSGSVSEGKRLISVILAQAGTIYVTSASSGSSERTLNVSDSSGNVLGTIATGADTGVTVSSAGTYYIYSASGGINVSKVSVYYATSDSSSSSSTTTTTTESTTETTTTGEDASSSSTTTTESTTESATESTTSSTSDNDGYAMAGTYKVGSSASGGDYNITTKTPSSADTGNVIFSLRDIKSTCGRVRNLEDGGYVSFELNKEATVTLTAGTGSSNALNLRELSSATSLLTVAKGTTGSVSLSAGSYIIESNTDSNAEIATMVIAYSSDTSDTTSTKGDANADGTVDANDVTHILQYVVGKITAVNSPANAEVTGDDTVDVKDAYKINKFVKKLIESLD